MKKKVVVKSTSKRKPRIKQSVFSKNNILRIFLGIGVFILLLIMGYHYRNGLLYYLGFKTNKSIISKEAKHASDVRNYQILSQYEDKVVGIDVSQFQGAINWLQVQYVENEFPIEFVFIRATVGKDKVDEQFETNWVESKKNEIIRGAYHYYRPNENSLEQATNFIKNVKLHKGDLPPVLDIEKLPRHQSLDSLKVGLRRWLEKVYLHYKVKPIIYTNEKYYEDFLKGEFDGYIFWIANYNFFVENLKQDWTFWQFTEKATISGIQENVDVTIYNGTPKMLDYLRIN